MALWLDYTFSDTGIAIQYRKISPMLATDVAAALPAPKPPEQEVDYGEGRGKVKEKNYTDPEYLQRVQEYNQRIFVALQRVMILRAVRPLEEDWEEQVTQYREFLKKHTGEPLDEPEDLVVYVLRICVGSEEDLTDFLQVLMKRSQPTVEVADAAKESFRSDVSGS